MFKQNEPERPEWGVPQRILDREVSDEISNTRRMQRYESAARRRDQETSEVRERFAIQLVPLQEHQDYAKLAADHLRIGTQRAQLEKELRETVTALARGMAAYNKQNIDKQVQAIIDGVEDRAAHGFEEMKARQVRLEDEVRRYGRAQVKVRTEMEVLRSERSIDAADAVRQAHRAICGMISDACAALQKSLRDHARLQDIVTDAGYDHRLPELKGISDLAELESRARGCAR